MLTLVDAGTNIAVDLEILPLILARVTVRLLVRELKHKTKMYCNPFLMVTLISGQLL